MKHSSTMSNEPASGHTPITTESTPSKKEETPKSAPPAVEYDDFGLPVRKARPRTPIADSSDSEQEVFADAVASKEENPQEHKDEREKTATSEAQEQASNREAPNLKIEPAPAEAVKPSEQSAQKDTPQGPQPDHSESVPSPETRDRSDTTNTRNSVIAGTSGGQQVATASEWSHQQLAPQTHKDEPIKKEEDEWQVMPAYAPYDIYNDDNKLIAREAKEEEVDLSYQNLGGAAKGYTRVIMDDDVESVTSLDDNTAYLFKETGTNVAYDDDESARDPLAQMQTTKGLLTEGQRIAYVGLVRLAIVQMAKQLDVLERTKGTKKQVDLAQESLKMWSQKMMVRLYSHMEVDPSEQIMIEQLAEHGVEPADLTPALMQNARVKNPVNETSNSRRTSTSRRTSMASPRLDGSGEKNSRSSSQEKEIDEEDPPPPYQQHEGDDLPAVRTPSQLPQTETIDIDIRWTILCDLFLVLIADSVYDARSRQLLEKVGGYLDVPWLEICRFEKRVTDALEMQEEASKENWNEDDHMESRRKRALKKRYVMMGLATVGGSLVIGLSAGLLAPLIGAGLAAGFTTIGVAGTGGFLAGAGGAAVITTSAALSGGTIAVRAANRRTGAVKTFEYRPLHNNKRVNLIVTISGWMNGKVDDVRLPYSTVDPIMGDIYSVLWEPEMLRSMGDTINILATEALTQGLQQVLGSTILVALMASLQLPIVLTKLSYLIDNPWTVSQARADMAGLILADSLIDRNLGSRPITLVGFSLGSRVIFGCLKELANRGAFGVVQNVYLFGTPVVAKKDEYIRAKSVVPGRFVNGYATNDWILGYLFRATSGGIMRVAGLAPVEVEGIENINVTDLVPGHMAYRKSMPRLLREVGWMVESDEFTEIEDPDPENHEKRQRELINEIEEARKELEKKPEKKKFSFWRSKRTEKKEWEVYDENSKAPAAKEGTNTPEERVLFDVDAIRAEAADLAAQGIQIKQLESTLPPMKLDLSSASSSPHTSLRETKSFNDSLGTTAFKNGGSSSNLSSMNGTGGKTQKKSFEEYDEFDYDHGNVSMTFDTSFKDPPSTAPVVQQPWSHPNDTDSMDSRPPLRGSSTEPNLNLAPNYNAWADEYEDDFGKEKEMKMTFE